MEILKRSILFNIKYTFLPASLLVSVFIAQVTLNGNYSKPVSIMSYGAFIFLLILFLEKYFPFKTSWSRVGKEEAKDLFHTLFGTYLGAMLGNYMNIVLAAVVFQLFSVYDTALIKNLWPNNLHLGIQVVLIMLISDFGRYWQHRLHHKFARLWLFHRLHHDDNILNVFKTSRSHIIERISQQTFMYLPLFLMGVNQDALFYFIMANSALGMFTHSNLDIRCGVFEYIFMSPRNHKIHHSVDSKQGNSNFGSSTVVWDILFGTFIHPKKLAKFEDIEVGIKKFKGHTDVFDQITLPFKQFYASFKNN